MKEITLTRGKIALIDDEMFDRISYFKWYTWVNPKVDENLFYAVTKMKIGNTWQMIRMHHVIIGFPETGFVVDHKNLNGLDNRMENLRMCTHVQNHMNTKIGTNKTSNYKGVFKVEKSNICFSYIQVNGSRFHLGSFRSEVDAAIAYNNAAIKYFGEYARLNVL